MQADKDRKRTWNPSKSCAAPALASSASATACLLRSFLSLRSLLRARRSSFAARSSASRAAASAARDAISAIKFYAARVLEDVIDRAIQVHGALGLTDETPLAKMSQLARGGRIYDGPDGVHRMVVARRILKAFADGDGWSFAGSPG